jgi:hypothetical protein
MLGRWADEGRDHRLVLNRLVWGSSTQAPLLFSDYQILLSSYFKSARPSGPLVAGCSEAPSGGAGSFDLTSTGPPSGAEPLDTLELLGSGLR